MTPKLSSSYTDDLLNHPYDIGVLLCIVVIDLISHPYEIATVIMLFVWVSTVVPGTCVCHTNELRNCGYLIWLTNSSVRHRYNIVISCGLIIFPYDITTNLNRKTHHLIRMTQGRMLSHTDDLSADPYMKLLTVAISFGWYEWCRYIIQTTSLIAISYRRLP